MIPVINLLPWREAQREKYRRLFVYRSLAVVAGTALLASAGYFSLQGKYDEQLARNAYLQSEIKKLDQTLARFAEQDKQRQALQDKLFIVNALQQQRNNVTNLLNFLPTVVPDGVYLENMSQSDGFVTLEGMVESNAQLATLLASLEQSDFSNSVEIHSIITQSEKLVNADKRFTVTFQMTHFVKPQLPVRKEEAKNG